MNPSRTDQGPAPRRNLWRWVAVIAAAGVLLLALSVWNLLAAGRETKALRQELLAALALPASPQVQISAGPILLGLARTTLAAIPDVPPEARQALRAVRAASVGVYQLREPVELLDRSKLLTAADRAMAERRWSRLVGVNDGHDTVLIYMPASFAEHDPLWVCLAVCTEDKLVLVAAVGEGEELLKLVQQHHRLTEL